MTLPRLRICLLIPTLDRSGAEKQFALLASNLPKDQFDVHAIALTRGGPYEDTLAQANVPLTILGKRFKFDPWLASRLHKELFRLQPDILHTWLFAANSYGRWAARSFPAIKVVTSERCVDSWKARWQLAVDHWLMARTDRLVGNSQSVVEFYASQGVARNKLECIPNGIEVPELQEAQPNRQLLESLGIGPDDFVAGYVGRLARQKRVQDIIWAIEVLRQTRPNIRLVIVGDGPERQSLENFAKRVHSAPYVRFVGHHENTLQWMRQLDAFCLASDFEGMSNSLMEAMSIGLPVIASDIPANRELIDHEQTGLLIQPHDSVGIMQYLRRLIDDRDWGAGLGRSAREWIQMNLGIKRMIDSYAKLYQTLAATPRR